MLDLTLQIILLTGTILFLIYIIIMVKEKKLELRYILVWLSTSICLIIITLIPGVLHSISRLLHIVEPVNTLFFVLIFFLILIIFSLTKEVSKGDARVRKLTQDIAFLKHCIEEMKKQSDEEK